MRLPLLAVAVVVLLLTLAWGTDAGALESLNNSAACGAAVGADEVKLEMAPAADATVPAGMPVTFSARSEVPLTFLVASTPTALPLREDYGPGSPGRTPDIDSGMGTMQPAASGLPTYTFTSLNAGVIPRVLYWEVSFPAASVPRCEALSSQPNETYQTQPRMLTVFAPPVPAPSPAPVPPPAKVSISVPTLLHVSSAVAFGVRCSEGCTGDTYYQAFILRAHHGPHRAPQLDLPRSGCRSPNGAGSSTSPATTRAARCSSSRASSAEAARSKYACRSK